MKRIAWPVKIFTIAALMAAAIAHAHADSGIVITPALAGLHPDDIPTGPQETTASLGKSPHPAIYQWGIIQIPSGAAVTPDTAKPQSLPVPEFVHSMDSSLATSAARLDYSALYIHPPMMRTQPMEFDISMTLSSGRISGWYPYGTASGGTISWHGVLAGVPAEGLDTTHKEWMTARAVVAPATLKVYKEGPPGTKPDDPGTTEGDVFLFARGEMPPQGLPFTINRSDSADGLQLEIKQPTTSPLHGWVIGKDSEEGCEGQAYRVQNVYSPSAADEAPVPLPAGAVASDQSPALCSDDLYARFNEAFVGSGLFSEEAHAMARLIETAIQQSPGKTFAVILLPQEWTDTLAPLSITGTEYNPPVRVFVAIAPL